LPALDAAPLEALVTDEPRIMTGESLSSGPYISMPFIMFQTVCDEVRLLREEVERLQEYLEDMTREAS
jgi:hypothetical protein